MSHEMQYFGPFMQKIVKKGQSRKISAIEIPFWCYKFLNSYKSKNFNNSTFNIS